MFHQQRKREGIIKLAFHANKNNFIREGFGKKNPDPPSSLSCFKGLIWLPGLDSAFDFYSLWVCNTFISVYTIWRKSDDSDWMQINSGLVAIVTNSEVKHNKKLIIKSQKITKQLVAIYNTT